MHVCSNAPLSVSVGATKDTKEEYPCLKIDLGLFTWKTLILASEKSIGKGSIYRDPITFFSPSGSSPLSLLLPGPRILIAGWLSEALRSSTVCVLHPLRLPSILSTSCASVICKHISHA